MVEIPPLPLPPHLPPLSPFPRRAVCRQLLAARLLEEMLCREVASVAASFEIRSSPWNAGIGRGRTAFEVGLDFLLSHSLPPQGDIDGAIEHQGRDISERSGGTVRSRIGSAWYLAKGIGNGAP